MKPLSLVNASSRGSRVLIGLGQHAHRPHAQAARMLFVGGDDLHGMWRVVSSSFRRCSTRQPSMSGRLMSRVMPAGRFFARHRDGCCAARGHQRLEAMLVGHVEQKTREVRIVFDDQQNLVVLTNLGRVISERLLLRRRVGFNWRANLDRILLGQTGLHGVSVSRRNIRAGT
jgi:hypothetical protein